METEDDAQFRARIKKDNLESTVHEMVADLIRHGDTQPVAWYAVRDAFTPDGVVITRTGDTTVVKRASQEHAKELKAEAVTASNASCSIPKAVQWTMDHLEDSKNTRPDFPGRTAKALWTWAIRSEQNKADFIKTVWTKLMPSQKDLDNQARYSDDGSKQIKLAERILARIAENAA